MTKFLYEDYIDFRPQLFNSVSKEGFTVVLANAVPASLERQWVPYYHFHIVKNSKVIGHVNFRVGNTDDLLYYDGHIGYQIFPAHRGMRASYYGTKLILPFIREHGFKRLVLTCHPSNLASRVIIESLGAMFQRTDCFPDRYPPEDREKRIYQLDL